MSTSVKTCARCGQEKVVTEFERDRRICLVCRGRKSLAKRDVLTAPPKTAGLVDRLRALLKQSKRYWSESELSDHFNVGVSAIRTALDELRHRHKLNIHRDEEAAALTEAPEPLEPSRLDVTQWQGQRVRIGVIGDNHLASAYERLDILNALFDWYAQEGVSLVYQCGNIIEGEARFNRFDLKAHGLEEQAYYLAQHWPQREGILTQFITGDDHEGWFTQREGVDVGRYIQSVLEYKGRSDLRYIGHMEHDVLLSDRAFIRFVHPGGGSVYAHSYTMQKLVESLDESHLPAAIFAGHFHKLGYNVPRGIHCVQVGATQEQTPFLRKRRIEVHLGGTLVEFTVGQDGLLHDFTLRIERFVSGGWRYVWPGRV